MASRTQRGDLPLAIGLLFLGSGTVAVALRRFPAAFVMFPALEGALTMGVVAFLLALGAGLTLRRALAWTAPAVLLQIVLAARRVPSFSAAIGLELAVLGGVGVALILFERAAAQGRARVRTGAAPAPARPRADAALADAE
ncbi:MAG TPA: hypothetical protein VGM56_09565 [Byssovorax sp.]|jgi:hypothetical protein